VVITRNGRERLVMISVDEYRRLRRSDRQVLSGGELSDADLAALDETRAPESSRAFDDELKSV
jgi:PHD/YefM family antitoxin component YafN of YafNO toxin-antitoxin module